MTAIKSINFLNLFKTIIYFIFSLKLSKLVFLEIRTRGNSYFFAPFFTLPSCVVTASLYPASFTAFIFSSLRSEERRVGKECRSRWSPYH